jgi:hypothetical protein
VLDAVADTGFPHVIAYQKFGEYKYAGDPRAQDILDMMARYALKNMTCIFIIISSTLK